MNLREAQGVAEKMRAEGFEVPRVPFRELSEERLRWWVEGARELWGDR